MFEPLDASSWKEFFFTIAAASATLIGLIVVGLSIHADYIAGSLTHRSHARATLVVLTATMAVGLVALFPQPREWAAWQRMAIGYAIAACGLIGAASIINGAGQLGGLYWIGLETVAALVWAIAGAWRFLIGVVDEQRP